MNTQELANAALKAYQEREAKKRREEAEQAKFRADILSSRVSRLLGEDIKVADTTVTINFGLLNAMFEIDPPYNYQEAQLVMCRRCDHCGAEFRVPINDLADVGELYEMQMKKVYHKNCPKAVSQ